MLTPPCGRPRIIPLDNAFSIPERPTKWTPRSCSWLSRDSGNHSSCANHMTLYFWMHCLWNMEVFLNPCKLWVATVNFLLIDAKVKIRIREQSKDLKSRHVHVDFCLALVGNSMLLWWFWLVCPARMNEWKDIYCRWKKAYSAIKQIQKGDMDLLRSKANPFPPKVQ